MEQLLQRGNIISDYKFQIYQTSAFVSSARFLQIKDFVISLYDNELNHLYFVIITTRLSMW